MCQVPLLIHDEFVGWYLVLKLLCLLVMNVYNCKLDNSDRKPVFQEWYRARARIPESVKTQYWNVNEVVVLGTVHGGRRGGNIPHILERRKIGGRYNPKTPINYSRGGNNPEDMRFNLQENIKKRVKEEEKEEESSIYGKEKGEVAQFMGRRRVR